MPDDLNRLPISRLYLGFVERRNVVLRGLQNRQVVSEVGLDDNRSLPVNPVSFRAYCWVRVI